ncbi:MAG: hypothetical protein IK990_00905 [Ruminiclostridium sp.]|nr:hypothetical protein [Ruminiclostridium sp.]
MFFKWGIVFEKKYSISEKAERKVSYCDIAEIEKAIIAKYGIIIDDPPPPTRMQPSGKVKTKKQELDVRKEE